MIACGFCRRENEDGARFCIDCGKPTVASAAQLTVPDVGTPAAERGGTVLCTHCGGQVEQSLPFCAHCGTRTAGAILGAVLGAAKGTAVRAGAERENGPKLALLDERGAVKKIFVMARAEAIVGRTDGDSQFSDDVYLSPVHAQFSLRDAQLWVRDLGSRNGTWFFVDGPHRLTDGDVVLVGSQLLRFRRLGYPGPHPGEADKTRRLGSLTPSADISVLAQLRADGSVRDTFHLSPGRNILIGRDKGDWLFPYDQTMSGTHAEVRSDDSDFVVADAGSRNGIAIAVRGERAVKVGQRILMGDRVLRVEHL